MTIIKARPPAGFHIPTHYASQASFAKTPYPLMLYIYSFILCIYTICCIIARKNQMDNLYKILETHKVSFLSSAGDGYLLALVRNEDFAKDDAKHIHFDGQTLEQTFVTALDYITKHPDHPWPTPEY